MVLTIALFFLGISLAFALIARKIWQFRTARIIPGSYEEADWTDLSILSIRMRLIEVTKFSVHHFVLLMLKAWIVVANWIRMTDRNVKFRLTQLLHRNGHLPEGGNPSEFLTVMHAHKDEVASAIEKESLEESPVSEEI